MQNIVLRSFYHPFPLIGSYSLAIKDGCFFYFITYRFKLFLVEKKYPYNVSFSDL